MLALLNGLPGGLIGKGWNYERLSGNDSLPLEFVDKNPELPWSWCDLIHHPNITCQFIIKHIDRFIEEEADVYYALSCHPDITMEVISQLNDKLDYITLSRYANPKFLDLEKVCWYNVSKNSQLDMEFIEANQDRLYWRLISSHSISTKNYQGRDSIIERFGHRLDWDILSVLMELNEETLIKYVNNWNLPLLVINQSMTTSLLRQYLALTEVNLSTAIYLIGDTPIRMTYNCYHLFDLEMVKQYQESIDWERLSQFIPLTSEFLQEFKDQVEWSYISINESITDSIIDEYSDRIDFTLLTYNPSLTTNIMKKYGHKFNKYQLSSHPNLTLEVIEHIDELTDRSSDLMEIDSDHSIQELDSDSADPDSDALDYWWWSHISKNLKFTERDVHRYRHQVDWYNLSRNSHLDVSAIIRAPWLPWDNNGFSDRHYPDLDQQWLVSLAESLDRDARLIEARPYIYSWELNNGIGLFKIDKLSLNTSQIATLIMEEYPIKCPDTLLQQLISASLDEEAILIMDRLKTHKLIMVKKTTSDPLINKLESCRISYSLGIIQPYLTIDSMKGLESGNITFTNTNNCSDLLRNYLDWRGFEYIMKVEGSRPVRPSYIINSKATIILNYTPSKKLMRFYRKLSKPSSSINDKRVRWFANLVNYDINMDYCTEFDESYWKLLELSRITNHQALQYATSIGLNNDLFNTTLQRAIDCENRYTKSKLLASCGRLAWHCQDVSSENVKKLLSMISYNEQFNHYIFNTLLVLAIRQKTKLEEYVNIHPIIRHLVEVKA